LASQTTESRPPLSVPQSILRHPLRTLSFTPALLTPSSASGSASPLGRLRRRSVSPVLESAGYRSSPSPIPLKRKLNVFDVLARGEARAEKRSNDTVVDSVPKSNACESPPNGGAGNVGIAGEFSLFSFSSRNCEKPTPAILKSSGCGAKLGCGASKVEEACSALTFLFLIYIHFKGNVLH